MELTGVIISAIMGSEVYSTLIAAHFDGTTIEITVGSKLVVCNVISTLNSPILISGTGMPQIETKFTLKPYQ